MADKPTNKERLKDLGEKIEAGIREVFDSGKYAEYLKVMSRFPTSITRCSFAYNALTRPKWPVTTSGSNLSAM